MKKILILSLLLGLIIAACGGAVEATGPEVTVYRSPTWGCCGDWIDYLGENDFRVDVVDTNDLQSIKTQYHVTIELQSCHTAIVDGYVIEGHVPIEEINRLLSEKPDVIGIAVAGMPAGSPGMEIANFADDAYDVISFDEDGFFEIYSSYPK